jgi:hypothetical protein
VTLLRSILSPHIRFLTKRLLTLKRIKRKQLQAKRIRDMNKMLMRLKGKKRMVMGNSIRKAIEKIMEENIDGDMGRCISNYVPVVLVAYINALIVR